MYDYAIRFERDDTPGLAVFCRDLPQFHSYGDDEQHAVSEAVDGIETTLSIYVDERRAIPAASAPDADELVVHLPAVTVAKIVLWNAMMERDMRKADLCRLLGVHQAQGDRLVDFLHTSKMEQLEAALHTLNVKLRLTQETIVDPLDIWINLPESRTSARFAVRQLVEAFGENRELVVGKSNANRDEIKDYSVDFILRDFAHAASRNTRQATVPVIDALVATGVFRRSRMVDPATAREVDSLALI
ncbi:MULTISPECIES: type II toxin-antitoxin system HicB family antitoxin [unclassified Pseudomonas]|jgi:predicted RNase H-like HicB family nuclease|uniref:type II toxin-antitoxin system HicB family antitoxin n=1 Tax=unclassified Pseudomonas TaxID=196821 RepID=UPI0011ADB275|nr:MULTISPECIES: type II toxin-antitoxin system HicB family antitoxin [unclassified Pseudomonas]TWC27689.1 putative RNase H-like HicB family nuclease [Pseudomonas sp. SJZ083]TWC53971.1 putative RNase H-like HicB family nuclease [Pseudomonas sp. SJZ077]